MSGYDRDKHGWNRDWETDNVPDDEQDFHEPPDLSHVHMETCPTCDMPAGECEPVQGWRVPWGILVWWCLVAYCTLVIWLACRAEGL